MTTHVELQEIMEMNELKLRILNFILDRRTSLEDLIFIRDFINTMTTKDQLTSRLGEASGSIEPEHRGKVRTESSSLLDEEIGEEEMIGDRSKAGFIRITRHMACMMLLEGREIYLIPCNLDHADERDKEHFKTISLETLKKVSSEPEKMIDERQVRKVLDNVYSDICRSNYESELGWDTDYYYYRPEGITIRAKEIEIIRLVKELRALIDCSSATTRERPIIRRLRERIEKFENTRTRVEQGLGRGPQERIKLKGRKVGLYESVRIDDSAISKTFEDQGPEQKDIKGKPEQKPLEELNLERVMVWRAREAFNAGRTVWLIPNTISLSEAPRKKCVEAVTKDQINKDSLIYKLPGISFEDIVERFKQFKCSSPAKPSYYIEETEGYYGQEVEIIKRAIRLKEVLESSPIELREEEGFRGLLGHLRTIPVKRNKKYWRWKTT